MNAKTLVLALVVLFLAPGAQALLPPLPDIPGVPTLLVQDQTITQDTTYENESLVVSGKIDVLAPATLYLLNVEIEFIGTSPGIELAAGAGLVIANSTLMSTPGENGVRGSFSVNVTSASRLRMENSTLSGGKGMNLSSDDASFFSNTFSNNGIGLQLYDVSITLEGQRFIGNTFGINQSHARAKIYRNLFDLNEVGIINWRSNPTVEYNNFTRCLIGIYHLESESSLSFNAMSDRAEPGGIGILVIDTESPIIEGNDISNWGTGILFVNARGFVRNNTIRGNVGDGLRVEGNSLTMDVQGNRIFGNGGDGIDIRGLRDPIPIWNNTITGNGGNGISSSMSPGMDVFRNFIAQNGANGIRLVSSPGAAISDNDIASNTGSGIVVSSDSGSALLKRNGVMGDHQKGIEVFGNSSTLNGNDVRGADNTGILLNAPDLTLIDGFVQGNGRTGIHLLFANDANVTGVDVWGHNETGILVESGANQRFTRVESSRNRDGYLFDGTTGASVSCARAILNDHDGLRVDSGSPPTAHLSWFEGNGFSGVTNLAASSMNAENNYWGHPDGPSIPANMSRGDNVSGAVDYEPFLATPDSCTVEGSLVRIDIVGPATMVAGTTEEFDLIGYDRDGMELPLLQSTLNFTAPTQAGPTFVRYTEQNITGRAFVEVVAGELASFEIQGPSSATVGSTATYTPFGFDEYGNPVAIEGTAFDVAVPTRSGAFDVTYAERGVTGVLIVEALPDVPVRIEVEGPAEVNANTTAAFAVRGFDQYENPTRLSRTTLLWQAPLEAGDRDVCYSEEGITGCTKVRVVTGALAKLIVSASETTVNVKRSTELSVRGYDAAGNEVTASGVTWSATAGSVDAKTAEYRAPSAPGSVTVTAAIGAVKGTLALDVTSALAAKVSMGSSSYGASPLAKIGGIAHVAYHDGAPVAGTYVLVFVIRTTPGAIALGSAQVTHITGYANAAGDFAFSIPAGWDLPGEYTVRVFPRTETYDGAAETAYRVVL